MVGWSWWLKCKVTRSSVRAATRHSVTLGSDKFDLNTAERRQILFPWEENSPPGCGWRCAMDGGWFGVVGPLGRRVPVVSQALLAYFLLCRWMGRPPQWNVHYMARVSSYAMTASVAFVSMRRHFNKRVLPTPQQAPPRHTNILKIHLCSW